MFTTTLELSDYPIMDVVRSTLFPHLPQSQSLVTRREVVEVVEAGARMCPQRVTIRVRSTKILVVEPYLTDYND